MKIDTKAFAKKAENYWYYYKWHTLGGAFLLLVLLWMGSDLIFRERYDMTIVVLSATQQEEQAVTALADRLEQAVPDWDNNGKSKVAVNYVHLADENTQAGYAARIKLTALLVADEQYLFLVDEAGYAHLNELDADFFEDISSLGQKREQHDALPVRLLADFPKEWNAYSLLVRKKDTGLSEKGEIGYQQAWEVLERLAAA